MENNQKPQLKLLLMCYFISVFVALLVGLLVTISMRDVLILVESYDIITIFTLVLRNSIVFGILFMYLTYKSLKKLLLKNNIVL